MTHKRKPTKLKAEPVRRCAGCGGAFPASELAGGRCPACQDPYRTISQAPHARP
jgi:hypothetical protein